MRFCKIKAKAALMYEIRLSWFIETKTVRDFSLENFVIYGIVTITPLCSGVM